MGSVVLPHLPSGWHVDQAILSGLSHSLAGAQPTAHRITLLTATTEEDRLVVIRFGRDHDSVGDKNHSCIPLTQELTPGRTACGKTRCSTR